MADNVTVGNTPGSADYPVRSRETAVGAKQVQSVALEAQAATVAAVDQDASQAVNLLPANSKRLGFVIQNTPQDDVADLFVKFGAGASASDYTRKLRPGETWDRLGGFTGLITGIWSAAGNGKARVTEETL